MTLLTRFRAAYTVGCLGLFGFLFPLFFIGPTAALNGSSALTIGFWSLAVVGFGGMAVAYFTRCPQCGLSLLRSSKRRDRAGVKGLMISCASCGYDLRQGGINAGNLYERGRVVAQVYAQANSETSAAETSAVQSAGAALPRVGRWIVIRAYRICGLLIGFWWFSIISVAFVGGELVEFGLSIASGFLIYLYITKVIFAADRSSRQIVKIRDHIVKTRTYLGERGYKPAWRVLVAGIFTILVTILWMIYITMWRVLLETI